MAKVVVRPLPQSYREIDFFQPRHPPIFQDGVPTEADIALARRLFAALDRESQEWHLRSGSQLFAGVKLARR